MRHLALLRGVAAAAALALAAGCGSTPPDVTAGSSADATLQRAYERAMAPPRSTAEPRGSAP